MLGTDTIQASSLVSDSGGDVAVATDQTSQDWYVVPGTFGPGWPFSGGTLDLTWSYGGDHRYLGNVTQATANWNNAATNVSLRKATGTTDPSEIAFTDVK